LASDVPDRYYITKLTWLLVSTTSKILTTFG
jgi:hypothetical protein